MGKRIEKCRREVRQVRRKPLKMLEGRSAMKFEVQGKKKREENMP